MHLFVIAADDARAFAHLHPQPEDTSVNPVLAARLPPLPSGRYRVFADVVHETGQERTLVGSLVVDSASLARAASTTHPDPDDAWFAGEPTRERTVKLADGSSMSLELVPNGVVRAGREESISITVRDAHGRPAQLEPYLGMAAHAVVVRDDGSVFVHLHPMGTVSPAAQQAFAARDRGDTTADGRLKLDSAQHPRLAAADSMPSSVQFPWLFPKSGSYRVFVQVRHNGHVETGAFALTVAEPANTLR